MQKVLVFDVAASSGGALSILKSFYAAAVDCREIQWVFVLSAQHVDPADNITVRSYDWIKKSRFHRLFFDYIVAPALVRVELPGLILSLQNINIPFVTTKQITYVHQAIPFCDLKFTLRKNPIEWLYQNIISRFIYKSIRKSDTVVVQTEWMKEAVKKRTQISPENILVVPPVVRITAEKHFVHDSQNKMRFFYPAAYAGYKNHEVIVRAVQLLQKQEIGEFEVLFTLMAEELPAELRGIAGIHCEGHLPFERMQELYMNCVLLFPSLMETFGLPLAEAGAFDAPIIAADLPYAREVLADYANAVFFDPHDAAALAEIMKRHICGDVSQTEKDGSWFRSRYSEGGWETLLQHIRESLERVL